jgi:DNA-binding transcriptional MerR regulator
MSETEEDRAYYAAAEAAFVRRRGTPFLLSPRDFALLREWRALGVPLEAVEAGIDEAFSRREERSAVGRVNSLSYCRDAVLEAWERRAETARGKGGSGAPPAPDAAIALRTLADLLEALEGRRADLAAPLVSARRSLARLETSGKTPGEIEDSLARLDRRLAREIAEALPEAERSDVDAEVARLLAGAGDRMDAVTLEKTSRALTRRVIRERLELPRLSLL